MFDETVFNRIAGGLSDLDKSVKALNDSVKALTKRLEAGEFVAIEQPIELSKYEMPPVTGPICNPEPWQFPRRV